MGTFHYFCAGMKIEVLPGKTVNYVLVSVPNEGLNDRIIKATIKMFRYVHTIIVYLDSGGFQIIQLENKRVRSKKLTFNPKEPLIFSGTELNITPEHVIEAAAKMNPNIVSALDYPIAAKDGFHEKEVEFHMKLGINVLWSQRSAQLRKELCPHVQLFIPVQCFTIKQFDLFMYYIKDLEFDGLSLPIRNLSPPEIALFLTRFYQMGIRKVHILGTTKWDVMALGAYMARHIFDWVSIDSTSWRQSAEANDYLNPNDFSGKSNLNRFVLIDDSIPMDCECPWCTGKTFTYIRNLPYTDRTSFLRCHNYWVTEHFSREVYKHACDLVALGSFLKSKCSRTDEIESLCRCLSLIETMKDGDIRILRNLLAG